MPAVSLRRSQINSSACTYLACAQIVPLRPQPHIRPGHPATSLCDGLPRSTVAHAQRLHLCAPACRPPASLSLMSGCEPGPTAPYYDTVTPGLPPDAWGAVARAALAAEGHSFQAWARLSLVNRAWRDGLRGACAYLNPHSDAAHCVTAFTVPDRCPAASCLAVQVCPATAWTMCATWQLCRMQPHVVHMAAPFWRNL